MQAIRGPLVLITLGALFALHQDGIINFSRTWPLIIIVIGLVKLVERLLLQPGYSAASYPAGTFAPGGYPPTGNYPGGTYQPPQPPPSNPGVPRS